MSTSMVFIDDMTAKSSMHRRDRQLRDTSNWSRVEQATGEHVVICR